MPESAQERQQPPLEEEEEPRQGLNKRLLIGVAAVVLAAVYLIVLSLDAASAVYLEADEVLAPGADVYDRRLRLGGTVGLDSIDRQADGLEVHFALRGETASIPVIYKGALPDIFGEGVTVFVEGTYERTGVFHANVLLARHPDTMEVLQEADTQAPHPEPS